MKKLLQTLAALVLGSAAAFAQASGPVLPTKASFNPGAEGNEEIVLADSTNHTITVTFDVTPSLPASAVLITGNGFNMTRRVITQQEPDSKFIIPVETSAWGIPYNQWYILQVAVVFMDQRNNYIRDEKGSPVVFQASYMTPDTGDARCVATFPMQRNINDEMLTLQQAYQNGFGSLYFTKEVDCSIATGSLTLWNVSGNRITAPLPLGFSDGEWSDLDGLYVVNFSFDNEAVAPEFIAKMKYSFSGFTASDATVAVPDIVLVPKTSITSELSPSSPKIRLSSDLAASVEDVKVYSLQGVLIMDNASAEDVRQLPAGVYIVNGEKVAVK